MAPDEVDKRASPHRGIASGGPDASRLSRARSAFPLTHRSLDHGVAASAASAWISPCPVAFAPQQTVVGKKKTLP